jgi:hypothetical protein
MLPAETDMTRVVLPAFHRSGTFVFELRYVANRVVPTANGVHIHTSLYSSNYQLALDSRVIFGFGHCQDY